MRTPYLYTLRLTVLTEEGPQFGSSETANVTVGFRTLEWDHSQGLSVNGEHIKIRGFCHHNDFTGVRSGSALPHTC